MATTQSKNIILITGANTGIGFELASQLLDEPTNLVLLGCRSAERGGAAVEALQAMHKPGAVELLQMDVESSESIAAAAGKVQREHGKLDALVNNASIARDHPGTLPERMAAYFKTNTIGPTLTVEAFAPQLRNATATPRIVNVTSGGGSVARLLSGASKATDLQLLPYRASKAALHMVTAVQALNYGLEGFRVFNYNPGFTVVARGKENKLENGAQPTSEGARPLVGILAGERDEEHGGFLTVVGQQPW